MTMLIAKSQMQAWNFDTFVEVSAVTFDDVNYSYALYFSDLSNPAYISTAVFSTPTAAVAAFPNLINDILLGLLVIKVQLT